MVILVGHKSDSAADKREAEIPASKMKEAARSLGLPADKIHNLSGVGESLGPWRAASAIAAEIGEGCDIVFNIKAGLKEQTVGVLQGYRVGNMPTMHLCSSGSKGPTLGPYREGDCDLCLAPTEWTQDLHGILATHDLLWVGKAKAARETAWRTNKAQATLINFLLNRPFGEIGEIVRAWNASKVYDKNDRFRADNKWKDSDDHLKLEGRAKELASSLDDAELVGDKLFLRSLNVARFLKGGWLETYVFAEIRRELRGHMSKAVVEMSVEFANARPPGAARAGTLGEIDVAVQWADKVLPIECKASHKADHARAILASDEWRRRFGGHGGSSLFVAPFIHTGQRAQYTALLSDLEARSQTPVLGWRDVQNIGQRVRDMVDATMP